MPRPTRPSKAERPAVFLDRDGTINQEVDYLADPKELVLINGAGEAIARLGRAGYLCIVVTNQSGIARGLLDESRLSEIHAHLDRLLAQAGGHIDLYEFCPHHPELGEDRYRQRCDCRKPAPGMLQSATEKLSIDLARSWIVGDSTRDLEAGAALEVPGLLVETGKPVTKAAREQFEVVADLSAAVDRVLSNGNALP